MFENVHLTGGDNILRTEDVSKSKPKLKAK